MKNKFCLFLFIITVNDLINDKYKHNKGKFVIITKMTLSQKTKPRTDFHTVKCKISYRKNLYISFFFNI